MKRIKTHLIGVICFLLLTGGCEWLELLPPNGLVLKEYWQSKEDVKATLMGAYSQFAQLDEKLFLYGELRADMISADKAPNYQKQIINNSIFSNNDMADWNDFYKVINYCNNVIEMAPQVLETDQTFEEIQMVSYQSEAVFLRSLAYYYLVRIFKDVPYVIKPTINDNVDLFVPKTSGDSILQYITDDLNEFRLTIPTEHETNDITKGRATKGAVNALLADISLWRFEYQSCLDYIKNIEDLNMYYLMSTSTWFEIYVPGNSLESIFEFQFDGSGQDNDLYDYTYNLEYFVSSEHAQELLDPLVSGERVRGMGSISVDYLGWLIWKYVGGIDNRKSVRSSASSKAANFIIYRYADILLMKAEALSQLENFSEAQNIINDVRSRALIDNIDISTSKDAFEDAILEERAKELAFEGKRWFDLMRMGRRNDYARKSKLIEIMVEDVPSTQKLVVASKLSDPNGWYLPVSEEELERNALLKQNPYYDTGL